MQEGAARLFARRPNESAAQDAWTLRKAPAARPAPSVEMRGGQLVGGSGYDVAVERKTEIDLDHVTGSLCRLDRGLRRQVVIRRGGVGEDHLDHLPGDVEVSVARRSGHEVVVT